MKRSGYPEKKRRTPRKKTLYFPGIEYRCQVLGVRALINITNRGFKSHHTAPLTVFTFACFFTFRFGYSMYYHRLGFITSLIYPNTTRLLRWAIGINYFWFGLLKFFNGLSPAEGLAKDTIRILTFGMIPDQVNLILLATWEVAIGLIFFSGRLTGIGARAAVVHMIFTFMPLFFFPEVSFSHAYYGFTIVGQYIVKNLVFLGALAVILKEEQK